MPTRLHISETLADPLDPLANYGDGFDGSKTISADEIVNEYTDLTANVAQSATALTVRDTSDFLAGNLVMIHQTQNYDFGGTTNRQVYEFGVIDSITDGTHLVLKSGLSREYRSDADGDKAENTKTQLVKVPRYTNLTVDNTKNLLCKVWDGYSGGIIAFKVHTALAGAGNISASLRGFRGMSPGADGSHYVWAEGWAGGPVLDTVVDNRGGGKGGRGDYDGGGGGGHNGAGGVHNVGVGGVDYGNAASDLETNLTMGGAGVVPVTIVPPAGGAIWIAAHDFSGYTGGIYATGGYNSGWGGGGASGGSILFYSPTNYDGTYGVAAGGGNAYGAVGYFYTTQFS